MSGRESEQRAKRLAIKRRDVKAIVKFKWGFDLAPGQIDIVRKIAFKEVKRLSISAMTRYGKTQCVAIGYALRIDFGLPVRIAFLGPKQEQAGIIRQYLSHLILTDREGSLLKKAQLTAEGDARLDKEASRKRLTFTTGAEYRVFSAEGEADRLMGFGCTDLVRDEAILISQVAYTKSSRMIGDDPENAMIVELYNPWHRDSPAFDHTLDPDWTVIQIGWRQAIAEGRTTKNFIEEQRRTMTPLEFEVLYESRFPAESEDSLYNLDQLTEAEKISFKIDDEVIAIEKVIKNAEHYKEWEVDKAREELKKYRRIISCDPADKGRDETTIYWGYAKENKFKIIGWYTEAKSESMQIVGWIYNKIVEWAGKIVPTHVNIDRVGLGVGAVSRLKEIVAEKSLHNVSIVGCHFGEKAIESDHYLNKKAENYFRSRDLFSEGFIDLPILPKFKRQAMAMKWERTSVDKKKVVDPEDYSPDWCDALVYFIWKDQAELIYAFS